MEVPPERADHTGLCKERAGGGYFIWESGFEGGLVWALHGEVHVSHSGEREVEDGRAELSHGGCSNCKIRPRLSLHSHFKTNFQPVY